jgi:hypothetical protein
MVMEPVRSVCWAGVASSGSSLKRFLKQRRQAEKEQARERLSEVCVKNSKEQQNEVSQARTASTLSRRGSFPGQQPRRIDNEWAAKVAFRISEPRGSLSQVRIAPEEGDFSPKSQKHDLDDLLREPLSPVSGREPLSPGQVSVREPLSPVSCDDEGKFTIGKLKRDSKKGPLCGSSSASASIKDAEQYIDEYLKSQLKEQKPKKEPSEARRTSLSSMLGLKSLARPATCPAAQARS